MSDAIASLAANIGNFFLAIIVGLNLRGQIRDNNKAAHARMDNIEANQVDKDTCLAHESSHDREIRGFRKEMQLLRATQEAHHREQIKIMMDLYSHLPKRSGE